MLDTAYKMVKRYANYRILGMTGVDESEWHWARNVDRVFRVLTSLVAIWLLVQWQYEKMGKFSDWQKDVFNTGVWVYFLANFTVPLLLVKNKKLYIRENWMLLIFLLLGITFALQIQSWIYYLDDFRPLLAMYILIPFISVLLGFFIDGQLSTSLIGAALIVLFFGVLVTGVDPNIKSVWDGVWWAIATISTVGYGDIVPTSPLGRLIGVFLIVVGLGVFVVITANFLAVVLHRQSGTKGTVGDIEIAELHQRVMEIQQSQQDILQKLSALDSHSNPESDSESDSDSAADARDNK